MDFIDFSPFIFEYFRDEIKHFHSLGGGQYLGLCPFHSDTNDSFSCNEIGLWNCKAGCGQGNITSFHGRRYFGGDNSAAYHDLERRFYGIDHKEQPKRKSATTIQRPMLSAAAEHHDSPTPASEIIDISRLEQFKEVPETALVYMREKRGWSDETIDKYRIGFNGSYWAGRGKPTQQRIVYPVFDACGNLVNIRQYLPLCPEDEHKVVSWSEKIDGQKRGYGKTRLYPISSLTEDSEYIILCEGESDALCGISHGLTCITQTAGAGTWKNEFNLKFAGKQVIVAYDNDKAGRAGIEKLRNLASVTKSLEYIIWPEWMQDKEDLTDWFVKYGKTAEGLLALPRETITVRGEEIPDELYKAEFEKLNEKHAVIMIGGQCLIMNERIDPITGRPGFTLSSTSHFFGHYAPDLVENPNPTKGGRQKISIAKLWFESKLRREYEDVVFDPNKNHNGYYNLWRGFGVQPKQGDWSLMRQHLLEVICQGNIAAFNYLMSWFSHIIQDPGAGERRPGVAVVLKGNPGTGKGIVVRQFQEILGPHFLHVYNQSYITGRFNAQLSNTLLAFIDEGFWAGDKAAEGIIKGLITEPTNCVEYKGRDVIQVKNHIRIIIASNNDWVVPVCLGERRFFVLEVGDQHMQERAYFKAIAAQMDEGGREAMLYDLLHHDIANMEWGNFPRTEALLQQIENSLKGVDRWWYECLHEGKVFPDADGWSVWVNTEELYKKSYIPFCDLLKIGFRETKTNIIRKLKEYYPRPKVYRKRNYNLTGNPWGYAFPSLWEAREIFAKQMRIEVNWDDNDKQDTIPF